MLSKKTNQALKLSGLAALALATACSEESEPSNNPPVNQFDSSVGAGDAGTQQPVGDAGAGGMCQSIFGLPPAVLCTTGAGQSGYRTCQNNVPVGDCLPLPSLDAGLNGLLEGGLGGLLEGGLGGLLEGGLGGIFADSGISLSDGGLMIGDATLPTLEAGTIKCPGTLMCLDALKSLTPAGVSACGMAGSVFPIPPPGDCTTGSGPCKLEGAAGTCIDAIFAKACFVPCN